MKNKIIGIVWGILGLAVVIINVTSFIENYDFLKREPMMKFGSIMIILIGILMLFVSFCQLTGLTNIAKEYEPLSQIESKRHANKLIDMYRAEMEQGIGSFMMAVLENAIHKLQHGVDPRKVENWVVKCEKLFREFI